MKGPSSRAVHRDGSQDRSCALSLPRSLVGTLGMTVLFHSARVWPICQKLACHPVPRRIAAAHTSCSCRRKPMSVLLRPISLALLVSLLTPSTRALEGQINTHDPSKVVMCDG